MNIDVLSHAAESLAETPTQCRSVDNSTVNTKPNDSSRMLFITTSTQYVRNVTDSHRNKSRLHKLYFM